MTGDRGQAVLIVGGFRPAGTGDRGRETDGSSELGDLAELSAREVPAGALSPGVFLRKDGTNAAHVQVLMDAAAMAELPPVLVQEDGWRIIDGLHRLEVARLRGDHVIKARFVDCTDSEALVLAMKANSSHGLPLSKADRLRGAQRVLAAHAEWSDRAIASVTGLSATTIASLRRRPAGPDHPGGKRLGRDGRQRPVSAAEGRLRAAEYISAHPSAPLRQVARETDVSLGTVHDVSTRLRRGISPEPAGLVPAARPALRPASQAGPALAAVPAAPDTQPRRKNHADAPPTWASVAAKLASDPAIRYTPDGREFLRWMTPHATDPDRWRQLRAAIPAHWQGVIAPIADSISREWSLFAEQLRNAR